MILIIKKASYDDVKNVFLAGLSLAKQYLTGERSLTVQKYQVLQKTSKLNKYNFKAKYLGFKSIVIGETKKLKELAKKHKRLVNLDSIEIIDDPNLQPFISVHLAFYNEENVAERCIEACLAQDYTQYEIVVADDSNDRTPEILAKYAHHPKIKIVRRDNRIGYKGGALKAAIAATDPRAVFINVYDADFVPPPNTLKMFMQEFFRQNGNTLKLDGKDNNLAAVQGYQWHVLNKDENFVTSGIRFGFAGGYMVERVAQQYFGAMKMIAGSVFVIRRDVMEKFTWQMPDGYTSIVEDWNLTIRMYLQGWKIGYTPDIKVPAECVNSLVRLSKQQIRWAEGHTWNVKTYFWQVMTTAKMTLVEKLEFLHYGPFYLQSAFFILGTFGWIVGELIFHAKVPGWTATLGWSLVFTNLMALPVMCVSGIVLERGENRDYNILPFLTFVYYIIPSLAYASVRGLLESNESGWVRTKKTGSITDGIIEGQMAGDKKELVEKNVEIFKEGLEKAATAYNKAHPMFNVSPAMTEELKKGRLWIELKRVPRLGFVIILIMAVMLGSMGYLASTQVTMASPDVLYLNSPSTLSYYTANSPTDVAIGPNNNSFSWYSDLCPIGDDPGGVAAGNYSAYLVLNQKPTVDKIYALSVGHVNETGGDYQAITSTTMTINQSTSNLLSINLGNGPEIVCNKENKRKLVFSIQYLSAPSQCDQNCGQLVFDSKKVDLEKTTIVSDNEVHYNEPLSILPPSENANMLVNKANAMVVPCDQEVCYYNDDLNYYLALTPADSGTFPVKGSAADQVTVTKTAPTSTGYLDLNLNFDYLPDELTNPYISLNFSDLDLHGDTVSSGSNTATLFETFKLYDANNNQLASLDSSYGSDDNFSWSMPIDKNLIINNSLTLRARMTATVTLKSGTTITLVNTNEGISDISICGIYDCGVPETIELNSETSCDGIELNWTPYTDQTITGYKLLRSTTDSELTYPEDGYYQYLTGQYTVSYQDINVTNGQGYYYRIAAYNNGTILAYSDTEYITADTVTGCETPETIALTAANDCGGVQLGWTKYEDHTITGYKLLRSTTDPILTYPEDGYYQYLTGQNTIAYKDTNVTNGQGYYYRIAAYNNGIILSYSDTEYIIADKTINCPTNLKITPILECVDDNGDGTYRAHFGYDSPNNVVKNIPVGNKNKFTPNPKDRGQTTSFQPGRIVDDFRVTFNGSNLSWYLKSPNGQSATVVANSNSPRCQAPPCCDDDLVIQFNNGTSSLATPSIIVPEFTLLFGAPLVGYLYLLKKRKEQNRSK
jgi:cellulose synthase/poly-beta-1,6-N-acetylglucosamine synthase-like glycosyltransferase